MISENATGRRRRRQRTVVYLDANVLSAGIVRTLIILSAPLTDCRVVWSPYAEQEAGRHQPAGAMRITEVRRQHGLPDVVPDREPPIPLEDTDTKDRPILASAAAAQAHFVVTENIKDFGVTDLHNLAMSAVHPDPFLATRITRDQYLFVLDAIADKRHRQPKTSVDIHATEVAKRLPQLFTVHRELFPVEPLIQPNLPKHTFRGVRCIRCTRRLTDPESQQNGLGPECRKK